MYDHSRLGKSSGAVLTVTGVSGAKSPKVTIVMDGHSGAVSLPIFNMLVGAPLWHIPSLGSKYRVVPLVAE